MKVLAVLLGWLWLAIASAAPQVSVLTFQPGEVYWQRYGHNALLVRNGDDARVYNYGLFDFQQKNFALNFARGRMLYRVAEEHPDWTLYAYQQENRWVREQVLNLTPDQARAVAGYLKWNVRPENADYRYDYFTANCSTRVRDVLDDALRGDLRRQLTGQVTGVTYRSEAARMMRGLPSVLLLTDFLLGMRADQPIDRWQRSFLPEHLMLALRDIQIDGRPLVALEREWLSGHDAESAAHPPSLVLPMALAGLMLALILWATLPAMGRVAWLGTGLAALLTLVSGLGGLVLAAFWMLTDHIFIARNQSLLVFAPLSLMLVPGVLRRRTHRFDRGVALTIVFGALLALALQLFPGLAQDTLHWVLFWLPIHLVIWMRMLRQRP